MSTIWIRKSVLALVVAGMVGMTSVATAGVPSAAAADVPQTAAAVKQPRPLDKKRFASERVTFLQQETKKSFPHLGPAFEVVAAADAKYNAIAHTLGIHDSWVWPGDKLDDFDQLYEDQGYQRSTQMDFSLEAGKQKIVLYGTVSADGKTTTVTSATLQEQDGSWTSKVGGMALIRHLTPDVLGGGDYGQPIAVYERHAN